MLSGSSGWGKVGLPGDQDQPGGTAIQATPFQAGGNTSAQTGAPAQHDAELSADRAQRPEFVPFPQHIVHHQANNILHDPVFTVEAVEQTHSCRSFG